MFSADAARGRSVRRRQPVVPTAAVVLADNLCTSGGALPDGGDGPTGDGGNNYAFVTSTNIFTTQVSNDQADAECRARANGILPGDFHAWFSAMDNAVSRFGG